METKCVSRAYTVANEDNTECILEPTRNNRLLYPILKNSKGYELEKEFNSGITHISPVWYDLKSQGAEFVLEGRHNVDKGWISDLIFEF